MRKDTRKPIVHAGCKIEPDAATWWIVHHSDGRKVWCRTLRSAKREAEGKPLTTATVNETGCM